MISSCAWTGEGGGRQCGAHREGCTHGGHTLAHWGSSSAAGTAPDPPPSMRAHLARARRAPPNLVLAALTAAVTAALITAFTAAALRAAPLPARAIPRALGLLLLSLLLLIRLLLLPLPLAVPARHMAHVVLHAPLVVRARAAGAVTQDDVILLCVRACMGALYVRACKFKLRTCAWTRAARAVRE